MTKIAHLKPEQEQDGAVGKRTEENLTRVARATATVGADVARESVEAAQRTADAAEDLFETTRKLAEKSPELGQDITDLLGEQTRQSVDTFSAFARAVNWADVAEAQRKLIAGSFQRMAQFNARYGAFLLRGMTATSPRR